MFGWLLVTSEPQQGQILGLILLSISVSGLDGDREHHEQIAK